MDEAQQLTDEAIQLRRNYYREYYKKNKEKRKLSNQKYWANKAKLKTQDVTLHK